MKTNYLLPHQFKRIGWIIFVPAMLLGIFFFASEVDPPFLNIHVFAFFDDGAIFNGDEDVIFGITKNNIFDELIGLSLIVSMVFIAFSRQKNEDEFIAKIRLESLVWATYVNYAILLIAILFVYGMAFFWIMVFNMFTILLFFIIRFNWALYKSNNTLKHEK